MTNEEKRIEEKRIAFKFCEGLFEAKNLLASDFEHVQVARVSGGVLVTFIAGREAVARASEVAQNALGQLCPEDDA